MTAFQTLNPLVVWRVQAQCICQAKPPQNLQALKIMVSHLTFLDIIGPIEVCVLSLGIAARTLWPLVTEFVFAKLSPSPNSTKLRLS